MHGADQAVRLVALVSGNEQRDSGRQGDVAHALDDAADQDDGDEDPEQGTVPVDELLLGERQVERPGDQEHHRDRGSLGERQARWFRCHVRLVDGDELRERADAKIPRPGEDLITHSEVANLRARLGDNASHVVAQREGPSVLQQLLELAVADHLV